MKIGIIGASGKAGSAIMKESLEKGFEVTAIVRNPNKVSNPNVKILEKDLFDLTKEDLVQFDVVVDAFAALGEDVPLHVTSWSHLVNILKGMNVRLIIVGGAGSLYVNPEHTIQLKDTPDFPSGFLPLASAMSEVLESLRSVKDVHWLYISPAADFQADADKTGSYELAGEEFTTNEKGKSEISYDDYAIAVVDEMINKNYDQTRISTYKK